MSVEEYAERIGCVQPLLPSSEFLNTLHRLHITKVPFENLDVYYKKPIVLDVNKIYRKVVVDGRGGFCYELNLLFNWLLNQIGFSSHIIAARIYNEENTPGPAFDHMAICLTTDRRFLVDVGYGDLFLTPIEMNGGVQFDGRRYYKIQESNDGEFTLCMSLNGKDFNPRYGFTLHRVSPADFELMCYEKQTNPNSYFVKNLVCTKPTSSGRITVFNTRSLKPLEIPKLKLQLKVIFTYKKY